MSRIAGILERRIEQRARTPRYSFREAAALVGRPSNTLRRWSIGNQRRQGGELVVDEPLIAIDGERGAGLPLSFLNLLELRMLSSYRDGAALPAIRSALDYAARELGEPRPLIALRFKVLGGRLFTRFAGTPSGRELLLDASSGGQIAFDELVRTVTDEIEYEDEMARRWWYHSRSVPLLVDTAVASGHPITAETGVRVDAITSRLRDGLTAAEIADDTGAQPAEVGAVAANHRAA